MAEWLRRWTRNPLGSPRAGSNPADYELFFASSVVTKCQRTRESPNVLHEKLLEHYEPQLLLEDQVHLLCECFEASSQ